MNQQSPIGPVSAYYHTHWDREWYLPFRSYQVRLATVVDEILERLETQVLPCFMLDGQTVVLEDYLELRPENRGRLSTLVQNGRLSIGPWFVMPDEFLVGGESLIRNLVRGIRESRDWGCHQFTGYLPDTFGHSPDIPTILAQVGLDSAVVWRGVNPKHSLFLWQSPSGATVKTLHLTDGYFQMMLHDWTANVREQLEALHGLGQKLQAASTTGTPVLLPIGGDHLAPVTAEGHEMLKALYPQVQETTPERFLSNLTTPNPLDTVTGELVDNTGSFLLPGVYSSRMYLKQANRKLEHLLGHKLEPLLALTQSLNWLKPLRYPTHELDLAWKTLMLNHPHDSICGCSVDAVHRENEVRYDQVKELGEAVLDRTLANLCQHLVGPEDWLVFNMGERPYTGVIPAWEDEPDGEHEASSAANGSAKHEVKQESHLWQVETEREVLQDEFLHDSHRIPLSHLTRTRRQGWIWAENIPPLGYKTLPKTGKQLPSNISAVQSQPNKLSNGLLSVQVEPNGTLTVTDLKTNRQYPNLLRFQAQPDQGDSYNSAPVPGASPFQVEFMGSESGLKGPLAGSLRLTHRIPALNMELVTAVRLQANSPLLAFETTFTNQTPDYKLQVGFSTGKPITEVEAESHLSIVTRHYDPHYREVDHMPVEKMKELKTNTGPVQRFFSANGQSWITQGLAEYEIFEDTLAITLLRAFGALSKKDTGVRGAQAGPPFETPEGQCLNREFHCEYAWLPTPETPQALYQQAAIFYGNVWAQSGTGASLGDLIGKPTEHALIQWAPQEVVLSACYWVPGKGLALRLLNPQNKPVTVQLKPGFTYKSAQEVNFLEEPVQALAQNSLDFELSFEVWHVKTVLFEV